MQAGKLSAGERTYPHHVLLALLLFVLAVVTDALKHVLSRRLQRWIDRRLDAWSSVGDTPPQLECENPRGLLSPAQQRLTELNDRILRILKSDCQ